MKTAEMKIEGFPTHMSESIVRVIPASQLSLSDEFLKYIPQTEKEKFLKEQITKVISTGVCDFYYPILNPCFEIPFYAVLIKELVASGKPVDWAWKAVCKVYSPNLDFNISKFLPNDAVAKDNHIDLANTRKLLAEDRTDYGCNWIVFTEGSTDH